MTLLGNGWVEVRFNPITKRNRLRVYHIKAETFYNHLIKSSAMSMRMIERRQGVKDSILLEQRFFDIAQDPYIKQARGES